MKPHQSPLANTLRQSRGAATSASRALVRWSKRPDVERHLVKVARLLHDAQVELCRAAGKVRG